MVPSKGLEPPHRCRYMDLNHARLPIPPRWQFWTAMQRRPQGRRVRKINKSILQPRYHLSNTGPRASAFPEAIENAVNSADF